MNLELEGRVVVVAAASKGLGRAVAELFASEGASVAICGRNQQTIDATADEIRTNTNAQVLAVEADVSTEAGVKTFIDAAVAEYGRIDTLVCNAGGPAPGGFSDVDEEKWAAGVQLTLMSAVRLIRFSLPHLKQSDAGRIVFMSSSSIKQPIPALILSNTLRVGLLGLAKTLAVEVAQDGILVNTIGPGRFDTDRVRNLDKGRAERAEISYEEQRALTQRDIGIGRYGQADEFAKSVVFFGSPANTYITGQSMLVDGGLVKAL